METTGKDSSKVQVVTGGQSPRTGRALLSLSASGLVVLLLFLAAGFGRNVAQARPLSAGGTPTQTEITGPAGSGKFGENVVVLPNGNFVVVDTGYDAPGPVTDVGAVYLYDGATLALISTLTGGTASDAVGIGITVLTNGNFVVNSYYWDNPTGPITDTGAVTWCSATLGCSGLVSVANSLVGGTAGDQVGGGGVMALPNGNYVVGSYKWDNPTGVKVDVGAATWGNGAVGITGLVSVTNSLVGGTANDQVGYYSVTALTNGNYVVGSGAWDNPAGPIANVGAATWGNGAVGTTGLVSVTNSLVGGTAFDSVGENYVGFGVTALTNGNYVVSSGNWDNPTGSKVDVGAATWGNGAVGTVGLVSVTNSLVGGTASDGVSGRVTALTNGNYVVGSGNWDNPTGSNVDVGAATWGNGAVGTVGLVSVTNSLVGGTASDGVGGDFHGVTALTNGNYVVSSHSWDNPTGAGNVGAATWGNGAVGTTGLVSITNSLVGGRSNNEVSDSGVYALTNGNYVVASPWWYKSTGALDVGAVTWGNGAVGTTGEVSIINSLVGGTANDNVGNLDPPNVTVLTNGNYVVSSSFWDYPPYGKNAGAVTWGNGAVGTTGLVSVTNSLVGGGYNNYVYALANGNYVVRSGAVTFGNGAVGTTGWVSSTNSVLGDISTDAFDAMRNRLLVGRGVSNTVDIFFFQTTATADGDVSGTGTWDNGVPTALTNVIIPSPRVVTVTAATSVGSLDIAAGATLRLSANLNLSGQLALGTKIDTGANTLALSCSSTVTGASPSNYVLGNLRKEFCAPTSGFSYPTGNNVGGAATGAFTYPVGTANGYSPVNVVVSNGGLDTNRTSIFTGYRLNPQFLTVRANEGTAPASPALVISQTLQRYWTLTETGELIATLTFNYLAGDVNGTESSYEIIRVPSGGAGVRYVNGSPCPGAGSPCVDPTAHTLYKVDVSDFSDWTAGEALTTYTLTVATAGTGSGVVSPTIGAYVYISGTIVTPTASANTSSTFSGWSGDCTGLGVCSVTMTANRSVTATFAINTYTLTVATAGTGSGVVSPTVGAHPYAYGTIVPVTATADPGSTFSGWSGDCSGPGACSLIMTVDRLVIANFSQYRVYLPLVLKNF